MSTQLARLTAARPSPDRSVAYGPEPDQVYDVYVPERPRGVTALLVHGGFWRPEYDRQHATEQAKSLCCNGFHVAVVEYRRPVPGWPTVLDDVVSATAAVRADDELPEPLLTMGHSAGGQIVLILQHQPVARGLLGTIALAPCADLRRTYDLGLGSDAALALMGTQPTEESDSWRAADPARHGVPPAPVHIVHGTADDQVPLTLSRSYVRAVDDPRVTLEELDGAGHYDVIDPESPHFARVLAAADATGRRA